MQPVDQELVGAAPVNEAAAEQIEMTDIIVRSEDPRLKTVRELLKNNRRGGRVMIVDDEENIEQAARHGVRIFTVFHTENEQLTPQLQQGLPSGTTISVMTAHVSKELFGVERLSRVFALARKPSPASLDDLTRVPGDIVVLDGVRLMGNVGAILRSARAFGAAGVVLLESNLSTVMDRRLIRASRGAVFSLPVVIATQDDLLAYLEEHDVPMACLALGAHVPLHEIAYVEGRLAILLGSEKHGPSSRLAQAARLQTTVAIHPDVESLNVSVAAALALYQRRFWNPVGSAPIE